MDGSPNNNIGTLGYGGGVGDGAGSNLRIVDTRGEGGDDGGDVAADQAPDGDGATDAAVPGSAAISGATGGKSDAVKQGKNSPLRITK